MFEFQISIDLGTPTLAALPSSPLVLAPEERCKGLCVLGGWGGGYRRLHVCVIDATEEYQKSLRLTTCG